MFYSVRLALGLLSASTEATLVDAANKRFGPRVGMYTLMLLCVSSGCFNASTSMYVYCSVLLYSPDDSLTREWKVCCSFNE